MVVGQSKNIDDDKRNVIPLFAVCAAVASMARPGTQNRQRFRVQIGD